MTAFCYAPHPDTPPLVTDLRCDDLIAAERAAYGPMGVVRCTRLAGHPGEHRAFGFSVSAPPMAWPAVAVAAAS
jgi:hypothetical protein